MSDPITQGLAANVLRLGNEVRDLSISNAVLRQENEELHKDYEALADEHTKLIDRNKNLKAEVERLRASSFVTAVPVEQYEKLKAEVERMTAEVNYRKNMDTHIKIMADQYTPAKEGKPSV